MQTLRTLYPEITPYHHFLLDTGSCHQVYVEESGNPDGIPVIFLHGGPCSGTKPDHRRFFDPGKYRIILFDQRGCGQSLPFGELQHNDTQALLDDMERIRTVLAIGRWVLFGGSWGGTLALLYAQRYPQQVLALVIRGVFLARQMDVDWFSQGAAGRIYPEQWERLQACVPEAERGDMVHGLNKALWGRDEVGRFRAAKEWAAWGAQVSLGTDYGWLAQDTHVNEKLLQQVRMELHYAANNYFIEENQILDNCEGLQGIPTWIVHGRNDLVCPLEASHSLHRALPHAEFQVLANSGHVAKGDEMIAALVQACDAIAERLRGG